MTVSPTARLEGMLPESHAFLTVDEVVAIRLYSGPSYQPINVFLLQIVRRNASFFTAFLCMYLHQAF